VHLVYSAKIWLSVAKLPLKCAVVSLYSVVKQRLRYNTGNVCDCSYSLWFFQLRNGGFLWTSLSTTFVSAQRFSERPVS
jgi:hypothetical protein